MNSKSRQWKQIIQSTICKSQVQQVGFVFRQFIKVVTHSEKVGLEIEMILNATHFVVFKTYNSIFKWLHTITSGLDWTTGLRFVPNMYNKWVYPFTGLEHWTRLLSWFYTCCDQFN